MQDLLETARAHADTFDSPKVHWLHLPLQKQEIGILEGEESTIATPDNVQAVVLDIVERLSSNGHSGAAFHVISHDGKTLRELRDLKSSAVGLQTKSFAGVRRDATGLPTTVGLPEDLPLEEAASLSKKVLGDLGHTSADHPLMQNRLRILMARQDARARKNHFSPR